MANSKISALASATTPLAGTEVLPVVQGGITEQVSVANLTAGRDVSASGLFVDANSATSAVRITQLGAGNALTVEDSSSPDATPFVIDASGNVIKGNATLVPAGAFSTPNISSHQANTATDTSFSGFAWGSAGTTSARISLARSNSTSVGTQSALVNNSIIGSVEMLGSDGTSFVQAASITAVVDGAPGTNDMPGRLVFSTTADGASTPTERMRIDSAGRVGIGSTSLVGYRLRVGGTIETTGTTGIGVSSDATIPSNVTGNGYGFFSQVNTASASFTLGVLHHFRANGSTPGAGSTITNQYGFHADSGLTGATNNYGFYSNIASAANRYNFYAAGTAQNLFSGDVLVFGAGGLGYTTGSGGTVTQGTSRTTGVTLNKTNGAITLFTAAGSIIATTFTVTNSTVAATDVVNVCQKSGTNLYNTLVTAVAAGSFNITFFTTGGIASDAPVFNFAVTKAVAA
jgi:hypothetical protein